MNIIGTKPIETERLMSRICFESQYIVDKESTLAIIGSSKEVLLNNLTQELNKNNEKDYSKNYRAYREIDYTDSLGVFDLNRKKIIECLIKNHDYNEKSEVGEYRRSIAK